jgi:hypothetical protein
VAEGLAKTLAGNFLDFTGKVFQPEDEQDDRGYTRHQDMYVFHTARDPREKPGLDALCA